MNACIVCDTKHVDTCPACSTKRASIHGAKLENGKLITKWLCVSCAYIFIQETMYAPATWHVVLDGSTHGPISHEDLIDAIKHAEITRDTQVWSPGAAAWCRAVDRPELKKYF
jgi:uncharacterized cysteine cluster protein YcgN (CxxCxxCC family)